MSYPGGKNGAGVFHRIIREMPAHNVYYEPFLGSGACLRQKAPALLNLGGDTDPDVFRRWKFGITGPVFGPTPCGPRGQVFMSRSYDRLNYPRFRSGSAVIRTRFDPAYFRENYLVDIPGRSFPFDAPDPCERHSQNLAVNTPAARYAFRLVDAFTALPHVAAGLAVSGESFSPDSVLVYCDPPYMPETRTKKQVYGDHELTVVEHGALLDILSVLPCLVMISGYASKLYADRLKSWRCVKFDAMTRGGVRQEHLWCNFDPPAVLHDSRFVGVGFRDRERIKRKKERWVNRLRTMNALERQALLDAIRESGVE